MILEEDNAIIVDRTTVTSILHTSFAKKMSCPLWMTRETIVSYVLGLGFPKNSRLKPNLDKVIRSLREHGLLNYWMRRELQNATYCLIPPGAEPSEQRSLKFQDFYGIFFLLFAGECISLTVFLAEVTRGKMSRITSSKVIHTAK
ncbi:uncharacterized protein LOC135093779 [Scylla paramamosain]|uniref:uncharacterized protein LOC135093779 n=1 Tax=Scylla paramamosain TaxID=85552 RepID=UPI0030833EC5